MTTQSTVLIRCEVQAGQLETAQQAFAALIATVKQNEPDCISIDFYQGDDDPQQLLLYERWRSREAYQGPHMQTAYMTAFIEDSMNFLTGPPDITFGNELEN